MIRNATFVSRFTGHLSEQLESHSTFIEVLPLHDGENITTVPLESITPCRAVLSVFSCHPNSHVCCCLLFENGLFWCMECTFYVLQSQSASGLRGLTGVITGYSSWYAICI